MIFKLCNNGKSVVGTREDGATVSYSIEAKEYKAWLEEGNIPEPEFTAVELLANAKAKKTQEIETAYHTALTADVVYMATTFQADESSIKVLNDTITALDATTAPAGFYWLDKANNKVPMTYAELKGLATAIALRGQALFGTRFDKKVAIIAALTIAEVEAVTW